MEAKQQRLGKISDAMLQRKYEEDPDEFNPSFKPKINEVSRFISTYRRPGFGTARGASRSDAELFAAGEQQWLSRREASR